MLQPLPLSPQLPSLDGRPPVARERAADAGERSAQRHAFGRLLDRFTQNDCGQEPATDPLAAPQDQRPRERCGTSDDAPRPLKDAATTDTETADPIAMPAAPVHDAAAPADPAKPAVDLMQAPSIPTPIAVEVPAIAPAAADAPVETASATIEVLSTVSTAAAMPAVTAAAAMVANGPAPVAGTPAAAALAKPAAVPGQAAAETTAAEPAVDTPDLGQVAAPTTRPRRTAVATGTTETTAKAANAAPADKPAADIAAPQLNRLPAARADVDMPVAANSNQGQPQFRIKAWASANATVLAGAREDGANAQSNADQAVANLTGIDSPRRTAALYHKVADAAKPGADAPTPADQVSIRLIHAVAEGKRAIQMHLHPAELGSIDVKMQWQGDRLTAQFTVDRPETLQLLQREVPALERSLGQAGVNVDSGSLSFSLRQQQGNGQNGGGTFDANAANAAFGEPASGDEPLGQVIRDGVLSIRV